jgi:hypothetical protein
VTFTSRSQLLPLRVTALSRVTVFPPGPVTEPLRVQVPPWQLPEFSQVVVPPPGPVTEPFRLQASADVASMALIARLPVAARQAVRPAIIVRLCIAFSVS